MRKRIATMLYTVALVMVIPLTIFADEIQDNFLADMAEGLNARWTDSVDENTMSSSEFVEHREKLVNEEYSRISKYAEEEFENKKFDLMAHAYIEALELQLNALKYYTEMPNVYETEWSAGYNVRAILIPDFVDYYGLEVEEDEVAEFRQNRETFVVSDTVIETENEENSGEISGTQEEILLYDDEGIKVVITGMEEPDLFSTKINMRVENLNHHDIIVQTQNSQMVVNGNMIYSPFYAQVQSGKTANQVVEFYKDLLDDAGIEKIEEMSLSIEILDATSFLPIYEGEEKFLTVDENYQIHEKSVYTDQESIQKVQQLLNEAGYDCGSADGVPGEKTNSALLQFERDHGLPETTDITPELIETLEAAIN